MYISGLAYHRQADSPVLLLRDIQEARLIPLLLSHQEAQIIINELEGSSENTPLSWQFSQWIVNDGFSVKEIRIMPRALGGGCKVSLKKGFRSRTLDLSLGDGVLFSIYTAVDLTLDSQWCMAEEHQGWVQGLSHIWSMNARMPLAEERAYHYTG